MNQKEGREGGRRVLPSGAGGRTNETPGSRVCMYKQRLSEDKYVNILKKDTW